MKIQKLKKGDYVTYIYKDVRYVAEISSDAADFKEAVGFNGEIQNTEVKNLYTLDSYDSTVSETLRESSMEEIKYFESKLCHEQNKKKTIGIKVVGKIDLDKVPGAHPKKSTKEENAEKREQVESKLSRQQKYGITGHCPTGMEAVIFTKTFSATEVKRGIAICKDENHFYVAFNLYGKYTTILDEHPDGLEPGAFPRGTTLYEITSDMYIENDKASDMLETYKEDINKYKALEAERERKRLEEEERKKAVNETAHIDRFRKARGTLCDYYHEDFGPLTSYINGTSVPSAYFPKIIGQGAWKFLGLYNFYRAAETKPPHYTLSWLYRKEMNLIFANLCSDLFTWDFLCTHCLSHGALTFSHMKGESEGTLLFRRWSNKLSVVILYDDTLAACLAYEYTGSTSEPFNIEHLTQTSRWTVEDIKCGSGKLLSIPGALVRVFSFMFLENAVKMYIFNSFGKCETEDKKLERQKTLDEYQKPQNGKSYIVRDASNIPEFFVDKLSKKIAEGDIKDGIGGALAKSGNTSIKVTEVDSYEQIKWKRVDGKEGLQPVKSVVSGYKKLFIKNN